MPLSAVGCPQNPQMLILRNLRRLGSTSMDAVRPEIWRAYWALLYAAVQKTKEAERRAK